ncbi:MAG: PHP domain-containing protein [Candidatus Undinarchaeales archaeon]
MKFEMHVHSDYSDGLMSVREIAERVKELGLDGFALTDHNTIEGHSEARKIAKKLDLKFIPGLEISAKEGHIIGLGISKKIKRGLTAEKTVERIKKAGGTSVAAHPYDPFRHGVGDLVKGLEFDYIESFNSRAYFPWYNWKASKEAKKLEIPEIAGSDAHKLAGIGMAVTETDSLKNLYCGKSKTYKTKWVGTPAITLGALKRKMIKYSNPDNLPFL